MCKCIIAGSRDVDDYNLLDRIIKDSGFKITEVVSGGATGVDKLGEAWANNNNIPVKVFEADWKNTKAKGAVIGKGQYGEYNKLAGFWRNEKMCEFADVGIYVIKDKSPGSTHCADYMQKLGKKIFVYEF